MVLSRALIVSVAGVADSLELLARANAFTALQRVKAPRCGRRCGIILGVGGMLAAAVAVEQVRRTFR
jgi:hypothetical protein